MWLQLHSSPPYDKVAAINNLRYRGMFFQCTPTQSMLTCRVWMLYAMYWCGSGSQVRAYWLVWVVASCQARTEHIDWFVNRPGRISRALHEGKNNTRNAEWLWVAVTKEDSVKELKGSSNFILFCAQDSLITSDCISSDVTFKIVLFILQVCSALLRGSVQHLSVLNVSKSVFPHRWEHTWVLPALRKWPFIFPL